MCVRGFARSCMGKYGMLMSLDRMLVGFGRVLMSLLMIALHVVLGGQVMVLRCFFVVLGGFLMVCFVCHLSCPLGNIPARSYACPREFGDNAGRKIPIVRRKFTNPNNKKKGD